jgi:3-dehydroquinate dehydratase-2
MTEILVLNGPNLNLLGEREPEVYGTTTLNDILRRLEQCAAELSVGLQNYQTNSEAEMIERIHCAKKEGIDFFIINPGAFTHTSIALRDAFLGIEVPFIEIHISNVFAREEFRKKSYLSDIAVGVISGMGAHGYELALSAAAQMLKGKD